MVKKELWRKIRYPSILLTSFLTIWSIFFGLYNELITHTMNWQIEIIYYMFLLIDFITSTIICLISAFLILMYYLIIFPAIDFEEFNVLMAEYIDNFRNLLKTRGFICKKDLKRIQRQSNKPKILLLLLLKSFELNYIFIKIKGFYDEMD